GPDAGDFDVRFAANTVNPDSAFIQLSYSWAGGAPGEQGSAEYRVWLTTTRPRYGGLRWWFACPLAAGGRPCRRRVAKLYLPPQARYFGCRHCHELTYTSCQTHDKRVDALCRELDLRSGLPPIGQGSLAQEGLRIKAIEKEIKKLDKLGWRYGR